MAKAKSVEKNAEELTYEEALAELERIVEALEEEQNPLEDAMKLFERGQSLVAHCGGLLNSAQLKAQKLIGDAVVPFDEEIE